MPNTNYRDSSSDNLIYGFSFGKSRNSYLKKHNAYKWFWHNLSDLAFFLPTPIHKEIKSEIIKSNTY